MSSKSAPRLLHRFAGHFLPRDGNSFIESSVICLSAKRNGEASSGDHVLKSFQSAEGGEQLFKGNGKAVITPTQLKDFKKQTKEKQ